MIPKFWIIYPEIWKQKSKVKEMLTQIKSLDENVYKRDEEIIEYWKYIDNSMTLHKNVAPDGLPQTPDHACCLRIRIKFRWKSKKRSQR